MKRGHCQIRRAFFFLFATLKDEIIMKNSQTIDLEQNRIREFNLKYGFDYSSIEGQLTDCLSAVNEVIKFIELTNGDLGFTIADSEDLDELFDLTRSKSMDLWLAIADLRKEKNG